MNGAIFYGFSGFLKGIALPWMTRIVSIFIPAAVVGPVTRALNTSLYILWMLPAYCISLALSNSFYGDIAERCVLLAQLEAQQKVATESNVIIPASKEILRVNTSGVFGTIASESYRILLFGTDLLYILLISRLPLGFLVELPSLCWLYALFSFNYKWSLHGINLSSRIKAIEAQWAYFAGFGSIQAVIVYLCSFEKGIALVGVLFPFFVITASSAAPNQAHGRAAALFFEKKAHRWSRIPIFAIPVVMTNLMSYAFRSLLEATMLNRTNSRGHRIC